MKKIQIDTTQNVLVQYQLASSGERFLALIIDVVSILLMVWITSLLTSFSPLLSEVLVWLIVSIYSPVMETFNHGRTFGKMAMNLKVIKVDGEQAQALDYISRWSTKGLEVYLTLGSLAGLVSYFSPKSQRIGDVLANTVVIKQESIGRLNLGRVTALKKYDDYEAQYPQVLQLQEDEVILIHETFNRFKKFKTEGHQAAFLQLVSSLAKKLEVEKVVDSEVFVKQLIKDYVILTRS